MTVSATSGIKTIWTIRIATPFEATIRGPARNGVQDLPQLDLSAIPSAVLELLDVLRGESASERTSRLARDN
jgi:hypothetical protein